MKPETMDKMGRLIHTANEHELEILISQIRARHETLRGMRAQEVLAEVEVGARVELCNIKPKYLQGMKGTVSSVAPNGKLSVDIDPRYNTRRYSHHIKLPASAVRVLPEGRG